MDTTYNCPNGHLSTDADYCSECGKRLDAAPVANTSANTNSASTVTSGLSAVTGSAGKDMICPDCQTPRGSATATFCEVCRYNFATNTPWSPPNTVVNMPNISANTQNMPVNNTPTPAATPNMPVTEQKIDVSSPAAVISSPAAVVSPSTAVVSLPAEAISSSMTGISPSMTTISSSEKAVSPSVTPASASPIGVSVSAPGVLRRWEAVAVSDEALYVDKDDARPFPTGESDRLFPLDFAENLVGRRSEKRGVYPEIALADPGVSTRHAYLYRESDGGLSLLDVGSTNGTAVNGLDISPGVKVKLADGDSITLGCWTRLTVRER